jgi:ribonuclease HII
MSAAASVLAKTYRDDYMNRIHEEFPMYNWKQNKGYPTKNTGRQKKHGVTKYHRMSFRLLRAIEVRHLILSFCPVTISIRL